MPAQGIVAVEVSPWQAAAIVWWLEREERMQATGHASGLVERYLSGWRDEHDVSSLRIKFQKIAKRKRSNGPFGDVTVQLSRADAVWIANKARPAGMFASGMSQYLPKEVKLIGLRCTIALRQKRGRKRLEGSKLVSSLRRAHIDERHRKRLRARQRAEDAIQAVFREYNGELARAIMNAEKST